MDFEYLDNERKKLWEKLFELENKIDAKLPENEAEVAALLKAAKEKTSEIASHLKIMEGDIEKLKIIEDGVLAAAERIKVDEKDISDLKTSAEASVDAIDVSLDKVTLINGIFSEKEKELVSFNERFSIAEKQVEDIESVFVKANDSSSKMESLQKSFSTRKSEFDKAYYEIFGYVEKNTETNEETTINGKKFELDNAYKILTSDFMSHKQEVEKIFVDQKNKITEFQDEKSRYIKSLIEEWENEVSAIKNKINGFLPHALTTGLSYAYSAQKDHEIKERRSHQISFISAILGMILVSSIPFAASLYSILAFNMSFDEAISKLPRIVLAIIPLYIPVLWIASASGKKINLSKRLIEEYSHKEALSKTYEGLSTQIAELDDSESAKELRLKLLYNILEVSSENPGKLISDYNKSDHPIMDALDKSVQLTSSIEKLARIPGFKKLAGSLSEKADKILADQNKKAELGLEVASKE